MVTTTFAAAALSVLLSPGANAVAPTWQPDYKTAMLTAATQQKPLAVFIGQGEAGKLVSDGQIPAEAGRVLASSYVCVYVDTATASGRNLASQFGVNPGLVISSKGGEYQALRHAGQVSATQLNGYISKYSDTNEASSTTEVVADQTPAAKLTPAVGYVGCAGGSCGYTGGCVGGSCGQVSSGSCGYVSGCGGSSCGMSAKSCGGRGSRGGHCGGGRGSRRCR